jgi:hypothetical protein
MRSVLALSLLLMAGCASSVSVKSSDLRPADILAARTMYVVVSQYFTEGKPKLSDAELTANVEHALATEFPNVRFVGATDKADLTVLFLLTDKIDCDECDEETRYWTWSGEIMQLTGGNSISLRITGETHKLVRHPEEVFANRLGEIVRPASIAASSASRSH